MTNHPEWALKHKRKGTELRLIGGNYYLYEVKSKWNPQKKRAQKITGRILGRVTPDGFIPSPKYELSKKPLIQSVTVKEYGATKFLLDIMDDIIDVLNNTFPLYSKEILSSAIIRLIHQSPAKNMDFHLRESYLSEMYPHVSLTDKKISSLFNSLGYMREAIDAFLKGLIKTENNHMLIDATHMFSKSKNMDMAQIGYNSEHKFIPQVNLMFIYALNLSLPVYYRIIPGNIREVTGFSLTLKASGIKDAVVIADKGFYSENNIKQLEEENIRFIIPLRRTSTLIDYSHLSDKEKLHGYFKFNNRFIWHYTYPAGEKRFIHIYLDEQLKTEEERDYLLRIEAKPESYTIDGFYKRQYQMGTLAILTNIESEPEETYIYYKSRNSIEVMIDALKNVLLADASYMRNNTSLEGWMFITFISLICYYRIYRLLQDKKLLSRYSPLDILKYFSAIKKVKIDGIWYTSEINTKTKRLIDKLGLHIT